MFQKAGISLAGVRLETMSSQEEKESSDWPDICNCELEIDTIEPSDYTKIDKPCTAKIQLDECKITLMEKDAKIISLKSALEVRYFYEEFGQTHCYFVLLQI